LARKTVTLSKRQLELRLGKLSILEKPRLRLEQYPVSPEVASELLYMAGFENEEINGQIVDLGTGTGRLAIGAALMGAESIVGVDLDKQSVALAVRNAKRAHVNVDWVIGNLDSISGKFDTVVMNPPYGTRSPHQDIHFLTRAFQLAHVTYSIHKSSTRKFLVQFVRKSGRQVAQVRSMTMPIPHLFDFHKKRWESIQVDLYRITS
jgi:putative methylase